MGPTFGSYLDHFFDNVPQFAHLGSSLFSKIVLKYLLKIFALFRRNFLKFSKKNFMHSKFHQFFKKLS